MNFGGAFLSSKIETLSQLHDQWIPKTIIINNNESFTSINHKRQKKKIAFPLIAKPDAAERGKGIRILTNEISLKSFFENSKGQAYLLQEYINYPIEVGILAYKKPLGEIEISSMGMKSFCTITGDGKKTLGELIARNHRVAHRKSFFKDKYSEQWNSVLLKHEEKVIETIGNHNRGTTFIDARDKINAHVLDWVADCISHLPQFDYGRIDLKISNWDAFKRKDNIKILEINGVNSEPIHIYDPKYSIIKAYRDIFCHMRIMYDLSKSKTKEKKSKLTDFAIGSYKVITQKNPCK